MAKRTRPMMAKEKSLGRASGRVLRASIPSRLESAESTWDLGANLETRTQRAREGHRV